jgi:hypothetical protein
VRADVDTELAIIHSDDLKSELQQNFGVSLPVRALARRFVERDAVATDVERRYEALTRVSEWLATHGQRDPDGVWRAAARPFTSEWQRSIGARDDGDLGWLNERLSHIFEGPNGDGESLNFGPIRLETAAERISLRVKTQRT